MYRIVVSTPGSRRAEPAGPLARIGRAIVATLVLAATAVGIFFFGALMLIFIAVVMVVSAIASLVMRWRFRSVLGEAGAKSRASFDPNRQDPRGSGRAGGPDILDVTAEVESIELDRKSGAS